MEYQKIIWIYCSIHQINHLNLGQIIGSTQMVITGNFITPIVKLNLKLHCESQVYVTIAMYTYFLKEPWMFLE